MTAEEKVPFIFLMIFILILLRPSDAFLHLCNFELVKEFGQKMLTVGNRNFWQKYLTLMRQISCSTEITPAKSSICPPQHGLGFYAVLQYSYYNYKKCINIELLLEYFLLQ